MRETTSRTTSDRSTRLLFNLCPLISRLLAYPTLLCQFVQVWFSEVGREVDLISHAIASNAVLRNQETQNWTNWHGYWRSLMTSYLEAQRLIAQFWARKMHTCVHESKNYLIFYVIFLCKEGAVFMSDFSFNLHTLRRQFFWLRKTFLGSNKPFGWIY